jgi:hypothetical protein
MCIGDAVYVCDFRHPLYRTCGVIESVTTAGEVVVELAIGIALPFNPHEIELDLRQPSPSYKRPPE